MSFPKSPERPIDFQELRTATENVGIDLKLKLGDIKNAVRYNESGLFSDGKDAADKAGDAIGATPEFRAAQECCARIGESLRTAEGAECAQLMNGLRGACQRVFGRLDAARRAAENGEGANAVVKAFNDDRYRTWSQAFADNVGGTVRGIDSLNRAINPFAGPSDATLARRAAEANPASQATVSNDSGGSFSAGTLGTIATISGADASAARALGDLTDKGGATGLQSRQMAQAFAGAERYMPKFN